MSPSIRTIAPGDTSLDWERQIVLHDSLTLQRFAPEKLCQTHRTDFYHIFILEDCEVEHWVDFAPVQAGPWSLLFIDRAKAHRFDRLEKYQCHIILFTEEFLSLRNADAKQGRHSPFFQNLNEHPVLPLGPAALSPFLEIYRALQQESRAPHDNLQPGILRNLLQRFLLLAEREQQKQGIAPGNASPEQELVYNFRGKLDERFRAVRSVQAYARTLGVTAKRLAQATAKILGKTPKQCIDERVVLEAKRLLGVGGYSVKAIALDLEFDAVSNFTKYFRKHTGNSPSEFRTRHAKAPRPVY